MLARTGPWSFVISAFVACLFSFSVTATAFANDVQQSTTLDLGTAKPYRNPTDFVDYYLDSSHLIGINNIENSRHLFVPAQKNELDFGHTSDSIWLRLPLSNTSDTIQKRYLLLETNWMESMRVWLEIEDNSRALLNQSRDMPFDSREYRHRNLVAEFEMPPETQGVLWINYSSPGSTGLPFGIETELSFVERTQSQVSKLAIYYVLMALVIVVALLSFLPFRHRIFLLYACYASAVLLYVMQRDGFAFQYLWPAFPAFNAIASLPLGASISLFAILFAREYLTTAITYPRADRLLLACVFISLLIPVSVVILDEQSVKLFTMGWVTFVAFVLLALGISAWFQYGNRMLFFVVGWFGIVSASLVMALRTYLGWEFGRDATLDSIRLAMVFDAIMMGFAMAERILQIRRERDDTLIKHIASLQSNLGLHDRLNALEARYAEASELAEHHGKVLADATHDIRQPLFALRASLKSIKQKPDKQSVASASRSLLYLENLVEEHMANALTDDAAPPPTEQPHLQITVPVSVILTAIQDMFEVDAKQRDLRLRVRDSTAKMTADPMAITRIVSNFVANAVRYTGKGGVLVGIRKRRNKTFIDVYDTGPGMTSATLDRVTQRAERGNHGETEGKGLGLDIALTLAKQHGLATIVRSVPGRGSLFSVAVDGRTTDRANNTTSH